MSIPIKIKDRQVGRNAELFARSIGEMETVEIRYPYFRILISIIEQAHPELNQAPEKDAQIAHLIWNLSDRSIDSDEVAEIVRLRDEERGYYVDKSKGKSQEAQNEPPAAEAKEPDGSEQSEEVESPEQENQSEEEGQSEKESD